MKKKISLHIIFVALSVNTFAQSTDISTSLNKYSCELYKEVKAYSDNVFISPLSTYYALMIACEGSGSDTRDEFNHVLHSDNPDLMNYLKSITLTPEAGKDSSNYLNIANAIWIQDNYKIESTYLTYVKSKYSADVKSVDFCKPNEASEQINQWVNDKTNGLIKNIITPSNLNPFTRLIISNAIYFIGQWAYAFDKNLTKPDDFYSIFKEKIQIEFMNKIAYYQYFENNDFQFVSIPYTGDTKSFCIILPQNKEGLADIDVKVSSTLLDSIFNNMYYTRVNLTIPKFTLETSYNLTDPLKQLGLRKAFTQNADFSGITNKDSLYIDEVLHKAYIKIDEEKTAAAASTAVMMMSGSSKRIESEPKIFKANHPFIFIITDNQTKGIIFIGRYVNPN